MRSFFLLCVAAVVVVVGLRAIGPGPYVSQGVRQARAAWQTGDVLAARQLAGSLLPELKREVDGLPADLERRLAYAEALALAGEPERGLSEAERAVAADMAPWVAKPVGSEPRESPLETLAIVATEAGAADEAVAARDNLLAHGGRLVALVARDR
jgi:hypothetical protein